LGIVGTFLLMAVLVWAMYAFTRPASLDAERAEERRQFLSEAQQADAAALNDYAWQDQTKGLVRLPIERALELTAQEWRDPAAARANLMARIEAATAPPPEPENPYE
jgi:hypothetical protein